MKQEKEQKKDIITITGRFLSRKNTKYGSDFCINVIHMKASENDATTLPQSVITRCQKGNGYDVTVTGYNLPSSKAKYYGVWEETKYGPQFKATSYEYVTPDTKKGLITFLSSKTFKGIGKRYATLIVDKYGMNSLEIIKEHPEQLITIKGLNKERINVLSETLKSTEFYNKLSVFLGSFGIESTKVMKIASTLGNRAVEAIKENPYCITEIEGIGFRTADEIAKGMAQDMASKEDIISILGSYSRIKAIVLFTLAEQSVRTCNTYTDYSVMFKRVYKELNSGFNFEIVSKKDLFTTINRLLGEGYIKGYKINDKKCIFSADADRDESEIAKQVFQLYSDRIPARTQKAYEDAFIQVSKNAKFPFSEDQKHAIANILKSRIAILNGGPGTGKSTCLKAITDCYKAVNPRGAVVQVAPTGKAARRMTESTKFPSDTIHRAIGIYTASDLSAGGNKKLPQGLVICDEVSMVDSSIMRCLLNSVAEGSQVVLVGDADQLPSVGAGNVLADMIASEKIPVYKLTENHRQASGAGIIIENARKVNTGNTNLVYNSDRFEFAEVNTEQEAWDKILQIYDRETRKWGADRVAILCPRRKDVLVSSESINKGLQDIVNPRYQDDPFIIIGGREFRVRDRVMQTKNTEAASNGDVGVIKGIHTSASDDGEYETKIYILFEDGTEVVYTPEDMKNVSLAYAMTIHKSQGSEYACVISPFLSSQKCPLFQRPILYTAITRASQKCIIVGDTKAVTETVLTESSDRETLLKERIVKQFEKRQVK